MQYNLKCLYLSAPTIIYIFPLIQSISIFGFVQKRNPSKQKNWECSLTLLTCFTSCSKNLIMFDVTWISMHQTENIAADWAKRIYQWKRWIRYWMANKCSQDKSSIEYLVIVNECYLSYSCVCVCVCSFLSCVLQIVMNSDNRINSLILIFGNQSKKKANKWEDKKANHTMQNL